MMQLVEALDSFFGGFGVDVYPENRVDADAAPPYMTVQLISPAWDQPAAFYARLFWRNEDYTGLIQKVDDIEAALREGPSIPTESGCVRIYAADPFCQFMPPADDRFLQSAYLSMRVQALTT